MHANALLEGCRVTQAIAAGVTSNTTLTGTIDMQGFDGVMFIGLMSTAATGNYIKAGQGDASNGSDAVDLAGSKVTPLASGNPAILDIFRPVRGTLGPRYLTVSLVRGGANTIVGGVIAIRYHAHKRPQTNTVASVADAVQLISPAEGTA